jgi:hypothetical protein
MLEKKNNNRFPEEEEKKAHTNKNSVDDFNPDFRFDMDVDENVGKQRNLDLNFRKLDQEKMRKNKICDFIMNHQNLSELRKNNMNDSVSSGSAINGFVDRVNSQIDNRS